MKTVVLYESQCGSTKKYAEDLAAFCNADLKANKKVKEKDLKKYDTVIFGGWVNNGKITGIDNFLSNWETIKDKNVIVFSNGIVIPSDEGRKGLISSNLLDMYHLRFYQLRGSFNLSKLKFPFSLIVKIIIKKVQNNPDASLEQKAFVELKDHPIEYYDYDGIDRIKNVLNKLESK